MKINMPQEVDFIIDKLNKNSFEAYIVGGCVRDSLLNRKINDWDICTNAHPNAILDIFNDCAKVIPTGIKHGTVTIVINKRNFEVTTYRIDGEYKDNRRPESVVFTSDIREDLSRRDFTINAMAYNEESGLIDPFDGQIHLENKVIKCVGDADKRFNEDALRMMRCIRFACQLNFEIHLDTLTQVYRNSHLVKNISMERVGDELCKILLSNRVTYGINTLYSTGILQYVIPQLCEYYNSSEENKNSSKNIFAYTLVAAENTTPKIVLRLAALLQDIGNTNCFTLDKNEEVYSCMNDISSSEMAKVILRRLKFDNETIKKVCILIKEHMTKLEHPKDIDVKEFINRVGAQNLEDLFELQIANMKANSKEISDIIYLKEHCNKIIAEKQPLSIKDLKITGNDLIKNGIMEGQEIGKILNELLQIVLQNPELNEKDKLIGMLSQYTQRVDKVLESD